MWSIDRLWSYSRLDASSNTITGEIYGQILRCYELWSGVKRVKEKKRSFELDSVRASGAGFLHVSSQNFLTFHFVWNNESAPHVMPKLHEYFIFASAWTNSPLARTVRHFAGWFVFFLGCFVKNSHLLSCGGTFFFANTIYILCTYGCSHNRCVNRLMIIMNLERA